MTAKIEKKFVFRCPQGCECTVGKKHAEFLARIHGFYVCDKHGDRMKLKKTEWN